MRLTHSLMRHLRLVVVALAATPCLLAGAATPAHAAEFSVCTTAFGAECKTLSVQAEGANVWIGLAAPLVGACYFSVVDENNGVVVRRGSFWGAYQATINGLYSRYYVKLYGCPGLAEAHISG